MSESGPQSFAKRVSPYVPRMLQARLASHPGDRFWTAEGTAVFVDISGFTKLSERLARKGREGSEQIADAIGGSFESILLVAYENGASLVKFGGDSLLLWFDRPDHAVRGCRACVLMRRALRTAGRITLPGAKTTLRMTQGVHSGTFHFFAAGTTHLELLPIGPAWSTVVAMEHAAGSGEILVSLQTAMQLPASTLGATRGGARLLVRDPAPRASALPLAPRPPLPDEMLARCLPLAVRDHVVQGGGAPEHRPVTIAFVQMQGTDAAIERDGAASTASALQQVIAVVTAACEPQGVALLASDVDSNGAKLILTSGAPTASGDDEERMLLAVRAIADAALPVPLRIGVHRGAVFAGDIGPFYRRTYTVMGDAVNLAARLMAKAEPGQIVVTASVLDRSNTVFATTPLEPFMVKGKAHPIQAWSIGRATGSRARDAAQEALPLVGRDTELATLRERLGAAREGKGALVEICGEAGIGKSRLLDALRGEASGFHVWHAVGEAYTSSTPYAVWRELLREWLGFGRDDAEADIARRLREVVDTRTPGLTPWLPLIGIAFGVEYETTPEVDMLAEKNRRPKLHEVLSSFLTALVTEPALIAIENGHLLDSASSELALHLASVARERPWMIVVARRPSAAAAAPGIVRIELTSLSAEDTLRLARLASEEHPLPPHVLDLVVKRSAGNPQFLRDLVHAAASGGMQALPDSAEAAASAIIDALAPADRALVRHAAIFGVTFHPRMLAWLEVDAGSSAAWARLADLFEEEGDGYLRFRRALVRDAAYEGLPYKLRRRLHAAIAAQLQSESAGVDADAALLSLHYAAAHEHEPAWRYGRTAARAAHDVYAYAEAAELYARSLDAARKLDGIPARELAQAHEAQGDAWNRASEFTKATDAYMAALRLAGDDALVRSELLVKRSRLEEKLGKYPQALRWAARARKAIVAQPGSDAARQKARTMAWYAGVLQAEGRSDAAIRAAHEAIAEAEAADDPDALASGCFVAGWAYAMLGKEGWEPLLQRSLAAYERSGDRVKQAVILGNVGVMCQAEGRWDEAVNYYEQGRDAGLKIGDTVNAALSRMNLAEIMIDRGELEEAEAALRETMPLWRSSKYRYFLAACNSLLGRAALRAGRGAQACSRFEEAKAGFAHVGADGDALAMDAALAECALYVGGASAALSSADALLASQVKGLGQFMPLLQRVRGEALIGLRDLDGARAAFEASLAAARERSDRFAIAIAQSALVRVDGLAERPPSAERKAESESLVASLGIRALPAAPSFG